LERGGELGHVRETTRHSLSIRYDRWLRWLERVEPDALDAPPEARATPERLSRWLEDMAKTRPMSRLAFIDGVLRVLTAAAPDLDWTPQRRIRIVLRREAGSGDPGRKKGRVCDSGVLLEAGLRLATVDAEQATTPLEALRRRRNGTMIAFLAVMPMRRRALAGLRLDVSLLREADTVFVDLPPELTKNGRPWSARVPDLLGPVLNDYLDFTRPALLARGGHDHALVWVGDDGRPFAVGHLGSKIAGLTQRLLGVRIPPHFFRDAAATTLVRSSPRDAQLSRALLGHAEYATSERHYVHAQGIEAGRDYAGVLDRLRRGDRT
ncbi:MAG: hypothetical protein AAFU61_14860, partial [Pseudomonadota bacterium]